MRAGLQAEILAGRPYNLPVSSASMRICLVTHGFPPFERTGVENYTAALAEALARQGHTVEVFAPRKDPTQAEYSLRRDEVGAFAVNWITLNHDPFGPREMLVRPDVALQFERFLERERPQVVHFQHVVKLGVDLIDVARSRGVPTIYTAHDYYGICHRYTLLRPDLERCNVRADSMACARCDLALGYLNDIDELGDYQMGALQEQLGADQRHGLAGILADDPEAASMTRAAFDTAFDRRRELDSLRGQAFHRLDCIIAPTRFLADELIGGGVDASKVEVLTYGIQNDDLLAVEPVRNGATEDVRFGFFGGLGKHKGVHVLIEAFKILKGKARLSIWGASTDDVYVDLMRERATEAGAVWGGPYLREDLPRHMAEVDVVVVPSIWVENSPLVIREAFSARRPVVTSDLGALPENVRDGVDGLLFPPGDSAGLARAMERLCQEEGLLASLASGIGEVKGIDAQAAELVTRYGELIESKASAETAKLLPSLREFVGRHAALGAMPSRELFRRALTGLDRLRAGWSKETGDVETEELFALALSGGSRTKNLIEDMRREVEWLRDTEIDLEEGRTALMEALEEAQRSFQHVETRLASTEEALVSTEKDLASTEEHLATKEEALASTEARLVAREKELAERERRIERAQTRLRQAAEVGLLALRTQEKIWNAELWPILERIGELTTEAGQEIELPPKGASNSELLKAFRGRTEALEFIRRELDWRRGLEREFEWRRERMNELQAELAKVDIRLRPGALGAALKAARRGATKQLLLRTRVGRLISEWEEGKWNEGVDVAEAADGEAAEEVVE